MSELKVRLLSGLVYVFLLILSTLHPLLLWIVLSIFSLICVFEFTKLIKLKKYGFHIILCLFILGLILTSFYFKFSFSKKLNTVLLALTITINLLLIISLFSKKNMYLTSNGLILNVFYITSGFIFLSLLSFYKQVFDPSIFLGCFILVWINDSFAYLVGKNFGKIKLLPSISPKKTVEGFLGGLIFAIVGSYFIYTFSDSLTLTQWIFISLIISILGTLGDLIESKFKRQAQVKDSGTIMPGHGGLLDRLDSIIFASPFVYLFLNIVSYVS